ncbi:MAG: hypothetical protein KAR39_06675 [Thermoplasmata archaeon]|nr:hypothetical protein [Thermoplasmata archaeon]
MILYIIPPDGPRVDPPIPTPTGSFSGVEVINATTANLTFGKLSNNPHPTMLNIIVENTTGKGTYFFQSDGDGSLILHHGDDMCNDTYHDSEGDEKVDGGDYLLFTGLGSKSQYTIQLIWGPNGELISQVTFSTPLS